MAEGISRWLVMRCFTITSASANALSTSPPSWWKLKAVLSGHSGCTAGAPGASAFSGSADRGQRFVIHFDGLGGVARDVAIRRHHHRNRVPDEVDAVHREDMMMRNTQAGQGSAARHRPYFLGVFSDEDRGDAGKFKRGLDVDRFDLRRAVRAAHDAGVVHAGNLNIVHISGGAGDQARIFAPADALPNQGFGFRCGGGHGSSVMPSPPMLGRH